MILNNMNIIKEITRDLLVLLKKILQFILIMLVFSLVIPLFWNNTTSRLFELPTITFWQAYNLYLLFWVFLLFLKGSLQIFEDDKKENDDR